MTQDMVEEIGKYIFSIVAMLTVGFLTWSTVINGDAAIAFFSSIAGFVFGAQSQTIRNALRKDKPDAS